MWKLPKSVRAMLDLGCLGLSRHCLMSKSLRLALSVLWTAAIAAESSAGNLSFDRDIHPLLDTYCFECHGAAKQKGDLNLESYATEGSAKLAVATWRHVQSKLHNQEMPPDKSPQPSVAERERIIAWIRQVRASGAPDPGRVTIRRLNRAEYNNTVRDLVGVDIDPAKDFPSDDVGEGFDNNSDVLSLTPLLLEKYVAAAEAILDKAIVNERVKMHVEAENAGVLIDGKVVDGVVAGKEQKLTAAGEVFTIVHFPSDGKCTIKVRCGAQQAGVEPATMAIRVQDQIVKTYKILSKTPTIFSATTTVTQGQCRIAVLFTNPFTQAEAPPSVVTAIKGQPAALVGKAGVRSLSIDWIEIQGPPMPMPPESHKRIFGSKPPPATMSRRDAAGEIVRRFVARAYRQPVDDATVERLMKIYDLAEKEGGSYEDNVKAALKTVLVSPYFLFRIERDQPGAKATDVYPIGDYELASRLSYFIWSSMPDEALFEQARLGKLRQPEILSQQVLRMIKDTKAKGLSENFAAQWLQLRNLKFVEPDPKLFPEFDKPLLNAMLDEATSFFEGVMREDRSVLEFLDSNYTYVNDRLAKHYEIAGVTGSHMRRVDLTDKNRGGVMTMAGVLAVTSNPNRTSPVKRGRWILDQILADPAPPPPPMVAKLPEEGPAIENQSLRQLTERHRADPSCAGCHSRLDPLGFGMENFDAIGRWRTSDRGLPLDTVGILPGNVRFNGPAELKQIFLNLRRDDFAKSLSEKMLIFALGRNLVDYDVHTIDKLRESLQGNDYKLSSLILGVVNSYPFLNRRNFISTGD
jgi:mono/diheme cytochrome c family protein